jgi:hypothetical protein
MKLKNILKIYFFYILAMSPIALANWEYEEKIDLFNDEDRSALAPTADLYGDSEVALSMVVKCEYDGLNILVGHSYMAGDSDDEILVELRVDGNDAYGPKYWSLQGNEASWMPISDVRDFVEQMKNGGRLAIRVTDPFDQESNVQIIGLVGFSKAIEMLSCY